MIIKMRAIQGDHRTQSLFVDGGLRIGYWTDRRFLSDEEFIHWSDRVIKEVFKVPESSFASRVYAKVKSS